MLVLKQLAGSQPAAYGRPAELLQLLSVLLGRYELETLHPGLDGPEEVSANALGLKQDTHTSYLPPACTSSPQLEQCWPKGMSTCLSAVEHTVTTFVCFS